MGRIRDAWHALRGYDAAKDSRASSWAASAVAQRPRSARLHPTLHAASATPSATTPMPPAP